MSECDACSLWEDAAGDRRMLCPYHVREAARILADLRAAGHRAVIRLFEIGDGPTPLTDEINRAIARLTASEVLHALADNPPSEPVERCARCGEPDGNLRIDSGASMTTYHSGPMSGPDLDIHPFVRPATKAKAEGGR